MFAYSTLILWGGTNYMLFLHKHLVTPSRSVNAGQHLDLLILVFATAGLLRAGGRGLCYRACLSSSRSRYFRV